MQYDKLTFGARFLTIAPALHNKLAPGAYYMVVPNLSVGETGRFSEKNNNCVYK